MYRNVGFLCHESGGMLAAGEERRLHPLLELERRLHCWLLNLPPSLEFHVPNGNLDRFSDKTPKDPLF